MVYLWRFIKRRKPQVKAIAILKRMNSNTTQLMEMRSSVPGVINGCRYTVKDWAGDFPSSS